MSNFLGSALTQLGTMAIGNLFKPKAEKAKPAPQINIAEEARKAYNELQTQKTAADVDTENELRQSALSLSRGELPDDIQAMIKMRAGEQSSRAGLSSIQSRNLTLRDLGLASLDAQQTGASLYGQIETMRRAEQQAAMDVSISKANQAYESYALAENARIESNYRKAVEHHQLWGGVGDFVSQAVYNWQNPTPPDYQNQYYKLLMDKLTGPINTGGTR